LTHRLVAEAAFPGCYGPADLTMAVDDPPLGALLRRHRRAAGLTQEELAERASISTRTISDVERGLRATVYRETADRLGSALGLTEEQLTAFRTAARGRRGPPSTEQAGRLPSQLTRLIGRESELEATEDALGDPAVRLLTLTGPGGVGKTRLAVEAANRKHADFPDGVFFVSLAATRESQAVVGSIAYALGVRAPDEPPANALARATASGRRLVLLDTFETVLEAASDIGDLLGSCPGLVLLVTSRAALRLRVERELPVTPLAVAPPDGSTPDRMSPGVQLFVDRARAVRPDIVLDDEGVRLAGEICRRAEGFPLAIELAAARARHMSLSSLVDLLDDRLALLSDGPRDLPARHHGMRDVVGWSYDLLEPDEQAFFRRLSVFAGGSTLPAATAIVGIDAHATLALMGGLVDKNLVVFEERTGGESRYSMFDVIRDYAADRLAAAGEAAAVARRHAEHFRAIAEEADEEFARRGRGASMEFLDVDDDNFRAAMRWAVGEKDADLALAIANSLWRLWMYRGQHSEARAWLRDALSVEPPGPPKLRVTAMWGMAWLAYHQGDYDETDRLGEEMVPLAAGTGDPIDRRNALTVQGIAAMARAAYDDALGPLGEAVEICRASGHDWLLATSLLNMGMASLHAGHVEHARDLLVEARDEYEGIGDRNFASRARQQLAHCALEKGRPEEAAELLASSLEEYRATDDAWGIAEALEGMSACLAELGRAEEAAMMLGAAAALRARLGSRPLPFDEALVQRHLERERRSIGEAAWESASNRGLALSIDEAVELASA
jgi:predicted ATPase/DNA-binding XRE family transcriptional regulator